MISKLLIRIIVAWLGRLKKDASPSSSTRIRSQTVGIRAVMIRWPYRPWCLWPKNLLFYFSWDLRPYTDLRPYIAEPSVSKFSHIRYSNWETKLGRLIEGSRLLLFETLRKPGEPAANSRYTEQDYLNTFSDTKAVFLKDITSGRRLSEIQASSGKLPYCYHNQTKWLSFLLLQHQTRVCILASGLRHHPSGMSKLKCLRHHKLE